MAKNQDSPPVNDPLGLDDVPAANSSPETPPSTPPKEDPAETPPSGKKKGKKEEPTTAKPRQGDENRPRCPNCSQGETVVLCTATSTQPLFTYYACPNGCGYTEKKPRPKFSEQIKREEAREQRNTGVVEHLGRQP